MVVDVKLKKYIIYMHTNKVNNKVYIGQTCQDFEKRCGSNGCGYRACPYFYAAIKKYGWDNFEHEILLTDLTKEEADEKEIEYIAKYDSRNPDKGYNIAYGGSGMDSERSCALWQDPDYVSNVISKMKALWDDEEYRKQRSLTFKEAWNDPERRKERSERAKDRWANQEFHEKARKAVLEACKKAVKCIETNEIFDSIVDAANKYNICHSNITRACKTGYKCGGYHWEYA